MPVTVGGSTPVVSADTIRSFVVEDVTGTVPMLAVIGRSIVADGVPRADADAAGVPQSATSRLGPSGPNDTVLE